jgi:hypothetical protein
MERLAHLVDDACRHTVIQLLGKPERPVSRWVADTEAPMALTRAGGRPPIFFGWYIVAAVVEWA